MSLFFMAGKEDTTFLRKLIYRNTDVVLMCFSIDSPDSMRSIETKWTPDVLHFCPAGNAISQLTSCMYVNGVIMCSFFPSL